MASYLKELKKIMDDKTPATPTALTKSQIEVGIAQITETLKGPLPNTERLMLVADRADLRKQLAAIDSGHR